MNDDEYKARGGHDRLPRKQYRIDYEGVIHGFVAVWADSPEEAVLIAAKNDHWAIDWGRREIDNIVRVGEVHIW